jgi:hypothetical protein
LRALARLISAGEVGTAETVASLLSDHGLPTDPAQTTRVLQSLAAQDLLQAAGEGKPRYEFQVDLVRLWIERYRSLAQAVQELV